MKLQKRKSLLRCVPRKVSVARVVLTVTSSFEQDKFVIKFCFWVMKAQKLVPTSVIFELKCFFQKEEERDVEENFVNLNRPLEHLKM